MTPEAERRSPLANLVAANVSASVNEERIQEAADRVAALADEMKLPVTETLRNAHTLNILLVKVLRDMELPAGGTDPKPDERVIVYPNGGSLDESYRSVETRPEREAAFESAKEKAEPGESNRPPPKQQPSEVRIDAELDELDQATLRTIARRDKAVASLVNDQAWAGVLSEVLKRTAKGPAKIVATIADSQIDAWGEINKGIETMARDITCNQIEGQLFQANEEHRKGAADFWGVMQRARGCR